MRIVTFFYFILFLNFKIHAQTNQKSKYNITQTGNNNKQYNTIINKEDVYHPDVKLMKQIADSMTNKSDTILLKFNSQERKKNLAFTKELKKKLDAKGYNTRLQENITIIDYNEKKEVIIEKGDNYLYIFVNKY